jgi:hypothetical protein
MGNFQIRNGAAEMFLSENLEKMKEKSITSQEFDELFDKDEDITEFLDLKNAKRPGMETKRKP